MRAFPSSFKSEQVRQIFDEIADRYDQTNAVLSLGMHFSWNRALCRALLQCNPKNLLDLCSGTGAIGLELGRNCASLDEIFLVDFSSKMLDIAKKRHVQRGQDSSAQVHFIESDVLDLPQMVKKKHFDAICIAYGLRNLSSPEKAFQQALQTLRPGGTFAILELTRPKSYWFKRLHQFYLKFLPYLGLCMTHRLMAYRYLSQSIENFADVQMLKEMALGVGFENVCIQSMHFGIASLVVCTKER